MENDIFVKIEPAIFETISLLSQNKGICTILDKTLFPFARIFFEISEVLVEIGWGGDF